MEQGGLRGPPGFGYRVRNDCGLSEPQGGAIFRIQRTGSQGDDVVCRPLDFPAPLRIDGPMTLLFDDTKKLEKALGEEAAGVLIGILEKQEEDSRRDIATKQDLREAELRLTAEMLRMKNDLTVRMGALLAATVAVIAALKFFG
ncbi:MAG: hypothetical protein RDU30_04120 [Desulfovibrionaceae bacterium]|nr:hypothetical protein [Desulfovibrionaceae bacterium]